MAEPSDEEVVAQLRTAAEMMSVEELIRFCDGTKLATTTAEKVFRDRFPNEWAVWVRSRVQNLEG